MAARVRFFRRDSFSNGYLSSLEPKSARALYKSSMQVKGVIFALNKQEKTVPSLPSLNWGGLTVSTGARVTL